jgi:hypothetical protein
MAAGMMPPSASFPRHIRTGADSKKDPYPYNGIKQIREEAEYGNERRRHGKNGSDERKALSGPGPAGQEVKSSAGR